MTLILMLLLAQADNPFTVRPAQPSFQVIRKFVTWDDVIGRKPEPPSPLLAKSYTAALELAESTKKPVIVWAGVPPRQIDGAIHYFCDSFPEVVKTAVVVGSWTGAFKGTEMERFDLPADADDGAIRRAARLIQVRGVSAATTLLARPTVRYVSGGGGFYQQSVNC